ncbi:MAG: guanylate kinase [Planctomycetes bacterium]|nr:guanylate kinase [Planctomycetota bacterium]
MSREGKLIVISGPSGVGKTTVVNELLKLPGFERVVTCTTRAPRPGEVDGRHYHFVNAEVFEDGIRNGRFLEHARVHSSYYGTPREAVEEGVRRGSFVLLNIDVQGAAQVRSKVPRERLTTIFLLPPDEETLERRLGRRGTEDAAAAASRLRAARSEIREKDNYDHCIVNGDLEEAVREILGRLGYVGRLDESKEPSKDPANS